ncbi:hypothetical protein AC578_9752 [Pseudocercospora eumusae]|uniref:N-acetyltransferase domain-containing protein n=1 Tax=Pseudocercospora eumusae TaxID=321146 RepID=A0A139HR09_9PEZI|nr:hypothetical protein AC578_9752 [Pseudocercospora eumusae]
MHGTSGGKSEEVVESFHSVCSEYKQKHLGQKPDLLLQVLATRPGQGSKGVGALAMELGCDKADELGLPACLEGSLMGLGLYKNRKFDVVDELPWDARSFGYSDSLTHLCIYNIIYTHEPLMSQPPSRHQRDAKRGNWAPVDSLILHLDSEPALVLETTNLPSNRKFLPFPPLKIGSGHLEASFCIGKSSGYNSSTFAEPFLKLVSRSQALSSFWDGFRHSSTFCIILKGDDNEARILDLLFRFWPRVCKDSPFALLSSFSSPTNGLPSVVRVYF